jgi:hypothetical protein
MLDTPTLLEVVWLYACWGCMAVYWLLGVALAVYAVYRLGRRFLWIFFDVDV